MKKQEEEMILQRSKVECKCDSRARDAEEKLKIYQEINSVYEDII